MRTAEINRSEDDHDAAASRAYYAAFYAVSALLALEGKSFKKHSAVEAALHRDLILTGRLSESIGVAYGSLRYFRNIGDYGGIEHVTAEQSGEAIRSAQLIIVAIKRCIPSA